jgi:hypothetical protein
MRWLTIGEPAATGLALPVTPRSTTLPRFAELEAAGPLLVGDGDRFDMRLTDLYGLSRCSRSLGEAIKRGQLV